MNFDGHGNGQYVLTVHPTNMMQSLPTATMQTSRDENSFRPTEALFQPEVYVRTESENSKDNLLSPRNKQRQCTDKFKYVVEALSRSCS
jgi:hypothetical protein